MSEEPTAMPSELPPADVAHALAYAVARDADPVSDRFTRGDVACLALRIIGVYVMVQALPAIALFVGDMRSTTSNILAAAIVPALYICMGALLMAFSKDLARWLLPRTAVTATELPGHGPAQLQAIAFSIIGVLLVCWSLPTLTYVFVRAITSGKGSPIQPNPVEQLELSLPSLLHYGIECGLGVWLFFGSKRLSTWWWSLRHPEFRDQKDEG